MASPEDLYVLILGETGVGKSTWINAIANYMQHETLEDAIHGKFTVLIPSSFDHVDEEGTEIPIEIGEKSKGEILQPGQSATQYPKEYVFKTDSTTIHFIDTPGIGDVRGIEKDRENLDNILAFLLKYEKIDAVCVLMKPNNSRLTTTFRFRVLELLTHLHKSLELNLLFCFTNSRGTFYRPGDTLPALKKLLAEHNIGLTLDKTRYFCFDNEAFRFLACLKNGVHFEVEEKETFAQSWEKSLKTAEKLVQRVKELPPHDTKSTLSLNEARSIILALTKPLAQIVQVIDNNKKSAESVQKDIDLACGNISEFEKSLKFKGLDLELQDLDYPMTVCAHIKCKKIYQVGQTQENNTVYPVICHHHCTIQGLPTQTTNDNRLATCTAFEFNTVTAYEKIVGKPHTQFPGYKKVTGSIDGRDIAAGTTNFWQCDETALKNSLTPDTKQKFEKYAAEKFQENCWGCGHSFKQHMHITYTTKVVEKEFLSEAVQKEINSKKDFKAKKDAAINKLTQTIEELKDEKKNIMSCASNFGSFLKHHSMVPYNDAFKEYIDQLIHNEKMKDESARDDERIQKLEKDKSAYQEKKEVLEKSMKQETGNAVNIDNIFEMRNKMVHLKHNGKAVKDALDGILNARQQHCNKSKEEKPVVIVSKVGFFGSFGRKFGL